MKCSERVSRCTLLGDVDEPDEMPLEETLQTTTALSAQVRCAGHHTHDQPRPADGGQRANSSKECLPILP